MTQEELLGQLAQLCDQWENEVVEFKEAGDSYSTDKIGQYFSALANEANLRGHDRAWLIFGVKNSTRAVVGTDYRIQSDRLQATKHQIAQDTEPSITFREIHEVAHPDGRVIMFEIPQAPQGMPIAWKGHYHGRSGESLDALGLDKQDEIRSQSGGSDWTAEAVTAASIDDLDAKAIATAKQRFAEKYKNGVAPEEVNGWDAATFLTRARLTRNGEITRAALLLLGRPESAHLLSPHPAQLTWKLVGPESAYEHLGPPFLLASSSLYAKIRNVQVRILPADSLLPHEVAKYDQAVVLEALHNCIAHQDYARAGRVVVTEHPDRLEFENEGSFFERTPADYIMSGGRTPRRYRNPFLTQAMVELNMIDTMGFGIYRMHERQARRYLPLPDYDLSDPTSVRLTIHGAVIDVAYSALLAQHTNLPIDDVLALDRVQKQLPIPAAAVKHLRRSGLIEGRQPNLQVSAKAVHTRADRADYILNRGQDDEFYEKLILDFIKKFGSASRKDVDALISSKLANALTEDQRFNKISNLLTSMRRSGKIVNSGSRRVPRWEIAE